MDRPNSPRPRKHRAINACVNCRMTKVKCSGSRPCQRCEKNDAICRYHDEVKDGNVLRIEKLEAEMTALRDELGRLKRFDHQARGAVATQSGTSLSYGEQNTTSITSTFQRLGSMRPNSRFSDNHSPANAVHTGLVTWEQASNWFQSFFSGSHYLVPVFCDRYDNLESVSSRSAVLFDAIVSIGCRAEEGFTSLIYRQLQSRVRDHLKALLINTATPKIEDVQAITVVAAYSEGGFVWIALALRFAVELGLPRAIDQLIAKAHRRLGPVASDVQDLYRQCRVWHGICNLELFFSLDGGKLPDVTCHLSSRKIRSLLGHSECTAVDIRLLSQVELNIIRTEAYTKIMGQATNSSLEQNEEKLRDTVEDATMELSLWLQEWTNIVVTEPTPPRQGLALQNLHIQYEWAMMTLYLKAVGSSGIENIAFMTDFQRDSVCRAKEAAGRHLGCMLQSSSSPNASPTTVAPNFGSTYLSTFRWTLDYVWAKCAVSVLLVLKLAILLRDPVPSIMSLLRDAHRVLEELERVTVGHIAYFQILQTSVEKCDAALREYAIHVANSNSETRSETIHGVAEDEFQGYVPNEFVFEWDFPGLNLKHMPFAWHDLFINIDNLF